MLTGSFKFVKDMHIEMKYPFDSSVTFSATYSGETLRGVAHGLGEFEWEGVRGYGMFH